MNEVDVLSTITIDRPRAEVAAFAGDPDNVTRWYANIASVEWETAPPVAVGSRVAFVDTLMTLRNRGAPSGFATLLAPLTAAAVRRANRKDLAALKAVLESGH